MKIPRRSFLHLAAGAAALPATSRFAWAQAYPTRPVRIIVPIAPAGANDITARLISPWLSQRLGRQFIVENRPGAASNIGTEVVARAAPNGYTLLLASSPAAINATLYDKLNFDFVRDITPVASIVRLPLVILANPSVLAGELFKMMAGVNLVPVTYRGAGPALIDLLGGQVQVVFGGVAESIGYIRARKLLPLAVTSTTRLGALGDVPTVADFVPSFEMSDWYGIGAPKNTPAEVINMLNKEINADLADPKLQTRLAELGGAPLGGSPADFGKLIVDKTEKWGKVIRTANIKAE
jgi:tripartite-type tricarboxylate transporter receptor subunit TctC